MAGLSERAIEYTAIAADKIIELDDFVAANRDGFAALYAELLNSPDRRDDQIEANYIGYFFEQSVAELGDESQLQYWKKVSESMELSFDELNAMPPNRRGAVYSDVRAIMSAVAFEQAFIESGIALYTVESGIEMGQTVSAFADVVGASEFHRGTGIKDEMKKKLADRKVGSPDSQFSNKGEDEK